jgi:hypothetical protein
MNLPVFDLYFGSGLRPVFQFALVGAMYFVSGKGADGSLAGGGLADDVDRS